VDPNRKRDSNRGPNGTDGLFPAGLERSYGRVAQVPRWEGPARRDLRQRGNETASYWKEDVLVVFDNVPAGSTNGMDA
jgi:hypothetical protein